MDIKTNAINSVDTNSYINHNETKTKEQETRQQLKEHCSSQTSEAIKNNMLAFINQVPEPTMRPVKEGFGSGFDKEYYQNGKIKSKTTPLSHKEYYENGEIKSKTTPFSHKEYNKFGILEYKENFIDGTKIKDGIKYKEETTQDGIKEVYKYVHTVGSERYLFSKEYPDGTKETYSQDGFMEKALPDGTVNYYIDGEFVAGDADKPKE